MKTLTLCLLVAAAPLLAQPAISVAGGTAYPTIGDGSTHRPTYAIAGQFQFNDSAEIGVIATAGYTALPDSNAFYDKIRLYHPSRRISFLDFGAGLRYDPDLASVVRPFASLVAMLRVESSPLSDPARLSNGSAAGTDAPSTTLRPAAALAIGARYPLGAVSPFLQGQFVYATHSSVQLLAGITVAL